MYIYVSSETCGNTFTGSFLESIGYPDPGLEHASSDALRSPQILQVGDLVSEVGMGVAGVWLLGWLLMGSEPQANSEDERFWNEVEQITDVSSGGIFCGHSTWPLGHSIR